jgi:hypothetical protein
LSAAKDTHWGIAVAGRFTLRGLESGFDDPDGFEALYGADLGYRPRIAAGTSTSNRARGNMVELTGADDDIIEIEIPTG